MQVTSRHHHVQFRTTLEAVEDDDNGASQRFAIWLSSTSNNIEVIRFEAEQALLRWLSGNSPQLFLRFSVHINRTCQRQSTRLAEQQRES